MGELGELAQELPEYREQPTDNEGGAGQGDDTYRERSRQLLKAAGAQHVASTLEELRDLLQQVVHNARPGATPEQLQLNSGLLAPDRKSA